MSRQHSALLFLCLASACALPAPAAASTAKSAKTAPTLPAFSGEPAFERQLTAWRLQVQAQRSNRADRRSDAMASAAAPPAPAPVAMEMSVAADAGSASKGAAADSITNVQTVGVDEGGIVKRHGDHLVVLRRGRLFTVRTGDDQLQPIASLDAFAPGSDPGGAWYDEMLVSGDTVVVIGYSYARGGTELVLFHIDQAGALRYRDTWHLRSNDYYSARNYASRLVGDTLVFYTPMRLDLSGPAIDAGLPGLRRWRGAMTPPDFKRILPATHIYRSDDALDPTIGSFTLHTVTRCDLAARELTCTSSAVLGPPGRVFYVSTDAVYVWTSGSGRDSDARNAASVLRMPLDGRAPTGLKTQGMPIDQLSFLQDASGHLNVLLSARGAGEGMWGDTTSAGDLALLRVALSQFGDGSKAAPASAYRSLPGVAGGALQNRFIGEWLLYGSATNAWAPRADMGTGDAHALRYAHNDAIQHVPLAHGVERIEAIGAHALLVGSTGADLQFTSVRLGTQADVVSTYVQRDAAQGESRTHGFFHRADGPDRGIVGLPILSQAASDDGSASVLYLRNRALALAPMGRLSARADGAIDDACRASCIDWYGNARPIFIGSRVFALLGYELVEGRVAGARISERRRVDFAPAIAIADGAP